MLQYLWNGIGAGTAYAAVAVAVTLIFGLARVVHFAVADFAMAGAMIIVVVYDRSSNWWLSVIAGSAAIVLLTVVSERFVFRFTFGRAVTGFLVSLGLILVVRATLIGWLGASARRVQPMFDSTWEIGAVLVRQQVAFNAALVLSVVGLVYAVLEFTSFGLCLRAIADSPEGARLMGVPVRRMISYAFLLTSAPLAAVAFSMVTTSSVSTTSADGYILMGFAAALIGGLGNVHGALWAGLLVGSAEHLSIGYGQLGWARMYVFVIVIALLLLRPNGLWAGRSGASISA